MQPRRRRRTGWCPRSPLPAVYLAEASDDLEDLRDEVKRYLDQAGYQVRPANRLPENIDGFEDAVRVELDRSVVYVQLLSAVAGRKFDGLDRRRVAAQHDLVAGRSMPVLLWRRRTPPDPSFDVFLSHNSKDKARVKALAERLSAMGLRVWFDDWNIKPGDDIYLAIERGLEAARKVVLCLSPAAVGSDWTGLERSTVLFRDPTNAGRRFVPLLLADCTLPDTLRRYKYVDFRQDTAAAFEELLTACRREGDATRPGTTATTENTARPPEQAEQTQPIALLGGEPEAPGGGVSGAAVSPEVKDSAHRKLLEDPEVMAVDIEEFKATIVERVRKVLTPQAPSKKEQIGGDYLVFVNAAEDDLQLAASVSQELDRRSIGYVLPLRQGQPSDLRQDLEQNLKECDGVILIFGRTGELWVRSQLLQARKISPQRDYPLRIIAVYEGPPPKEGTDLGIKLPRVPLRIMRCYSGPDEFELNGFVDALRAGVAGMTSLEGSTEVARPYPGLRPFQKDEADIFFGREEQTDQILGKLSLSRFLGVVGTSGCGKSSLAMAGLIPALETGLIAKAGFHWRVAIFKPGNRPLENLAEALLEPGVLGADPGSAADDRASVAQGGRDRVAPLLLATLRRGPLGLADVLTSPLEPGDGPALPPKQNLLLLVDQFEEVFRFRREGDLNEADAFVALLLATAAQDRAGLCRPHHAFRLPRRLHLFTGLPEALNGSQFLTPRLTREQRRAAIEGPAKVFGGVVEPALVGRLLNDMGPEPDQLPLMQHALMRLWDIAERRAASAGPPGGEAILTIGDYMAIGGLAEALDKHAEEAFASLGAAPAEGEKSKPPPDQPPRLTRQQAIAETLFRCLTEREYGGRDTLRRDVRRPTRLSTVADVAGVSYDQVFEVAEAFRAPGLSFITPPSRVPLDANTILDLTHESLIRRWKRLQGWVEEEARSVDTYRHLEDRARLYRDGEDRLLVPPALDRFVSWRAEQQPSLPWAQRYGGDFDLASQFLEKSQTAWKSTAARKLRNRSLAWAGLACSILLVVVAGLALREWGLRTRAEQAEIKARGALTREISERTRAEQARIEARGAASRAINERRRAENAEKVVRTRNAELTVLSKELEREQTRLISSNKEAVRAALSERMFMLFNQSQMASPTNPQQGVLLAAQAVKEATQTYAGTRNDHTTEPEPGQLLLDSETALRRTLMNISGAGLAATGATSRASPLTRTTHRWD